MATTPLNTLDLTVTCANGNGTEQFYIDCSDHRRSEFLRQQLTANPFALAAMTTAFPSTYRIRLSLAHDHTLTLALPTRVPHLPNGGLPSSVISQIRAVDVCEPFLFLHSLEEENPTTRVRHRDVQLPQRWHSSLRRLTMSFVYNLDLETGMLCWREEGRKWELYTSLDPTNRDMDEEDHEETMEQVEEDFADNFSEFLEQLNAQVQTREQILTAQDLFLMQKTLGSGQIVEPAVARIRPGNTEGGKRWTQRQTREKAARMYRTACLGGEGVGWRVC
ncbi:unnamed protein product [Zymoseptoria tritici ST99CH_1A5]|uniref:Uncharacterized protein n=1 Tax=Zymoseptoria tritici ST99CH_1A5 TaxID=1276529 RepID=A0A1Y6LQG4_ZYMTR|nr:unnamed protein product [Zymoseptoria tritici ST99CH_1A5]